VNRVRPDWWIHRLRQQSLSPRFAAPDENHSVADGEKSDDGQTIETAAAGHNDCCVTIRSNISDSHRKPFVALIDSEHRVSPNVSHRLRLWEEWLEFTSHTSPPIDDARCRPNRESSKFGGADHMTEGRPILLRPALRHSSIPIRPEEQLGFDFFGQSCF
jgi:hypothetical protein